MFSDQKLWRHGERCRSIRTRSTTFPPEPSVSARRTRKRCVEQIFCSLMEEQPSRPFVKSKRSSPQQRRNDSTPTSLLKALHVAVLPVHTQRSSSASCHVHAAQPQRYGFRGWQHMVAGLQHWSGYKAKEECKGKRRTKDRAREFCFQTGEPAVNVRLSVLRNAKVAKRMWPNTLGVASWCKPHFSPHNVPHTLHAVQMCAVVTVKAAKLLFLVVASCCSVRWGPCTSYWHGRVIIIIHGG